MSANTLLTSLRTRGHASGPLFAALERISGGESHTRQVLDIPNPGRLILPSSGPSPMRTVQDFAAERATARVRPPKNHHAAPLFKQLGELVSARAPAESWLLGHPAPPEPAPARRLTPAAPDAPMRTVHDFAAGIAERRAQVQLPAPLVLYRPVESLTACMDSADCPDTAKKIFRVLFDLALLSVHERGRPVRPDVGVFHLPAELLAAHIERDRVTVWRNLQPLIKAGVLAERDHYGTLRGQTALTGKVWAVSLCPERVLSGHASAVKVTKEDLKYPWRDLDRDAKSGRTAYAITRTEERQRLDKARREERAEADAAAQARAAQRLAERAQARKDKKTVPRGRAAATLNAAETRAKNPRPTRRKEKMQQSVRSLKAVERGELEMWVIAGFATSAHDVILTVAPSFTDGLDAVFSLPSLAGLPRGRRNKMVEETARTMADAFQDTRNLKFWCWLIWQTLRGCDQGQDYTQDIAHIMARVLHDIRQDEQMGNRAQRNPAALVVNGLRNCGLLDILRAIEPTRVGKRPSSSRAA